MQQFKFYDRTRVKGESIATFIALLQALAEYHKYDLLNMMFHYRLVCVVNHKAIQQTLLSKKELTQHKSPRIGISDGVS